MFENKDILESIRLKDLFNKYYELCLIKNKKIKFFENLAKT